MFSLFWNSLSVLDDHDNARRVDGMSFQTKRPEAANLYGP